VTIPDPIVFLIDVDNTLLDNDRIQADLKLHLERVFGAACRDRYWTILEQLFAELGYRDYLGALQRYRVEHPTDIHLLTMSSYLVDYPFANRLYRGPSTSSSGSGAGVKLSSYLTVMLCFSRGRWSGRGSSRRSMGMY
jgi:hypothetical protein